MSPVDRTVAPAPGPLRPFDFPAIDAGALSNGVPLDVIRLPRLPVATAYLVLPAREDQLGPDDGGLSILTAEALEGGTARRSGAELAVALEELGADVDVHAGWSSTTVSLSCLSDRLDAGLRLLGEMVREPGFDEAEVERARQQQLARIRQQSMDPGSVASHRAQAEFYADGEPYGRPAFGSAEAVEAWPHAAVKGWAESAYHADGAALVVAGDVDPAAVRRSAGEVFGDWAGRPLDDRIPEGRPGRGGGRIVVVDLPSAVQSEIRIGHVGVPRSWPRFAELTVGTSVLGGTFSSRLNLNLREKHGFTYGVRARFSPRRGPGPFQVSTAVDTENTPAAIREAFSEIRRLLDEGPTAEEIDSTRDYLAGIFPLRLESTGQVASRVAESRIFGLPDDEWTGYRERIRAVTADGALSALRAAIRPDELVVVVSGNAGALRPGLEALGLGPVEVVERDAAG